METSSAHVLSVSEPYMSVIPEDPWENSTLPATPSVEEVLLLGWQANTKQRRSTKALIWLRSPASSSAAMLAEVKRSPGMW